MATDDEEAARRAKFNHHIGFFGASTRYPAPYIGFTGRPGFRFEHHCLPYDAMGFHNPEPIRPRTDPNEVRVFVAGDSTMLAGTEWWDTVPGYVEAALRERVSPHVKVINFGAISSCTEQMCSLIWMRLLDLDPDALVVVSGATDAFQPYTFDPRPGFPYNAFINEYLYTYFFDELNDKSWNFSLSFDELAHNTFDFLAQLRESTKYGTPEWESAIAGSFETSLRRIVRSARAIDVPLLYLLEPVVVRKAPLEEAERDKASPEMLAYLARQYDRFEAALARVTAGPLPPNVRLVDASRILNGGSGAQFYDIVHYDRPGRAAVGAFVAERMTEMLQTPAPARSPAAAFWARARDRLGGLVRASKA